MKVFFSILLVNQKVTPVSFISFWACFNPKTSRSVIYSQYSHFEKLPVSGQYEKIETFFNNISKKTRCLFLCHYFLDIVLFLPFPNGSFKFRSLWANCGTLEENKQDWRHFIIWLECLSGFNANQITINHSFQFRQISEWHLLLPKIRNLESISH